MLSHCCVDVGGAPDGVRDRVRVGNAGEGRGRGLFATQDFEAGASLFLERPLVALQSRSNISDVMVCGNCLGFVGTVGSQLALLEGTPREQCLKNLEAQAAGPSSTLLSPVPPVHCSQGCGEVYCSGSCRKAHFTRCHRLECVGLVSAQEAAAHPLIAFKVHALQTNEIFLLVGEVAATVVLRAEEGGYDEAEHAWEPFRRFVQEPWWEVAVDHDWDEKGQEEFRESLRRPDPACLTGLMQHTYLACSTKVISHHLSLCVESSSLFRTAIEHSCQLKSPRAREVLAEKWGRIIGMFEQNNVGIRLTSPLYALAENCGHSPHHAQLAPPTRSLWSHDVTCPPAQLFLLSFRCSADCDDDVDDSDNDGDGCCGGGAGDDRSNGYPRAVGNCSGLKQCCEKTTLEQLQEGDLEHLFQPLDGTALYDVICCMNHSCQPNSEITYKGGSSGQPLMAQVRAITDIAAGEELTQSYIDKELSLEDRQRALEDYGFKCSCSRCELEGK
ncbi:unnamed protein product [Chrysoparadoxa australica]